MSYNDDSLELEELREIVKQIPDIVEQVAADCNVEYTDRPSLYKRGNKWRYHLVRATNDWEDGDTPLDAIKKLHKKD
jgi:hypothetical protein